MLPCAARASYLLDALAGRTDQHSGRCHAPQLPDRRHHRRFGEAGDLPCLSAAAVPVRSGCNQAPPAAAPDCGRRSVPSSSRPPRWRACDRRRSVPPFFGEDDLASDPRRWCPNRIPQANRARQRPPGKRFHRIDDDRCAIRQQAREVFRADRRGTRYGGRRRSGEIVVLVQPVVRFAHRNRRLRRRDRAGRRDEAPHGSVPSGPRRSDWSCYPGRGCAPCTRAKPGSPRSPNDALPRDAPVARWRRLRAACVRRARPDGCRGSPPARAGPRRSPLHRVPAAGSRTQASHTGPPYRGRADPRECSPEAPKPPLPPGPARSGT